VGFLKAFVLFWLMPARLGPHLAVQSFARAFAAHVLAVAVATALIAGPLLWRWVSDVTGTGSLRASLHTARVAVANEILKAAAEPPGSGTGWLPIVTTLAAFPAAQVGLLLLATLVMPWAAGGDRASSVWRRSVKNTYWSTTFIVPIALLITVYSHLHEVIPYPRHTAELILMTVIFLFFTFGVIGYLRILVCGASRYVGEPDGPAFAAREPTCDECGYAIVHLSLETRCPECGLPVRDSLPGGRRKPTGWHVNELRPRGVVELVHLQWTVLQDRNFFKRLPVQSGMATARHFWWATYILMCIVSLTAYRILYTIGAYQSGQFWTRHPTLDQVTTLAAVLTVAGIFVLQMGMVFVGCLWAQFHEGIRDYRVSAVVCYFGSPMLWPIIGLAFLTTIVFAAPVFPALLDWKVRLGAWRPDGVMIAAGVLTALYVGAVVFWWSRLVRGVTAVRYADV
jgi:hypothetical protein